VSHIDQQVQSLRRMLFFITGLAGIIYR